MTSNYVFASPWALSKQGRIELVRSFKESASGAEAQILPESSDAEVVCLICSEQCFMDFFKFASKFYERELSRATDVFDEPKLTRLDGTAFTNETPYDTDFVPPTETVLPVGEKIEGDQLIHHEDHQTRWISSHKDDGGRFWQILPTLIGRIERTTGVRLQRGSNEASLTIFSDSKATLELTIQKLNALEKSLTCQVLTHHHLVAEGEPSPQLCLLPMKEVLDIRLGTTLISPFSIPYNKLPNFYILIMVQGGEIRKVDPSVQTADSTHLWDGYDLTLLLPEGEVRNTTKATPVSRWVDESNAADVVDPFAPQIISESASDTTTQVVDPVKVVDPKPSSQELRSTKRVRKVKGAVDDVKANTMPSQIEQDGLERHETPCTEANTQSSGPTEEVPHTSFGDARSFQELSPQEIKSTKRVRKVKDAIDNTKIDELPLQAEQGDLGTHETLSTEASIQSSTAKEVPDMRSGDVRPSREQSSLPNTDQSQAPNSSRFDPPTIQPPFMPPSSFAVQTSWEPVQQSWEHQVASNGSRPGDLIVMNPPPVGPHQPNSARRKIGRKVNIEPPLVVSQQRKAFGHTNGKPASTASRPANSQHIKFSGHANGILIDIDSPPVDLHQMKSAGSANGDLINVNSPPISFENTKPLKQNNGNLIDLDWPPLGSEPKKPVEHTNSNLFNMNSRPVSTEQTSSFGQVSGDLTDIDWPVLGSQQEKSSKRKMHRTMGQKKGQSTADHTQLVECCDKKVREMLYSALPRCGVKISVSVGRILMDRRTIPKEYRKKQFGIDEWERAISQVRPNFTERLTAKSSDGSHIINLKLSGSRRLFNETPLQRNVSYVIGCVTKSGERIDIEICEGGKHIIRGDQFVNGVINWHFVKRAWDACLQVTSYEFVGGEYEEEVSNFVQSLKHSQPSETTGLNISFSSKRSSFQVQSIKLKREIVHATITYPDLLLHITEVQMLKVSCQIVDDADVFTGSLAPQEEMIANDRLWWEASISSYYADHVLGKSASLEIGETTTWRPETVLKHGLVDDMYALTQEIVTRMDQVGMGNKAAATTGTKKTSKSSTHMYELPTGTPGYW